MKHHTRVHPTFWERLFRKQTRTRTKRSLSLSTTPPSPLAQPYHLLHLFLCHLTLDLYLLPLALVPPHLVVQFPRILLNPLISKRRAAASGRWYCPVPSCPDHCPVHSRGWASFPAMKGHCDRHLGDYLEGELPLDWLREVGYGVCEVCTRILSTKFRGRCPSCWPAFVSSRPRPISGRPLPDDMPPLDLVLTTRVHLRTSVPRGAKNAWSTCLNTALAGIIAHRDTRAWTDFLILPSLVLPHPPAAVPAAHAVLPTKPGADARTGSTGSVSNSGILLGSHRLAPWRRNGSRLQRPPLIWMSIPLFGFKLSSLRELCAGH